MSWWPSSVVAGLINKLKPKPTPTPTTKTPDELIDEAWKKEALLISRAQNGITQNDYYRSYAEVRMLYESIYTTFKYSLALNKLAMLIAGYAKFTSTFINKAESTDKDTMKKDVITRFNNATQIFDRAIHEMETETETETDTDKETELKKINYYKTKSNKAIHILKGLIITEPEEILVSPDVTGSINIFKELCESDYAPGCHYLGYVLYECSMKLQIDDVNKTKWLKEAIVNLEKSNSISVRTNTVNTNNRENINRLIELCNREISKSSNSVTQQRFEGAGGSSQLKRTSRTTKSRKHRKRVSRNRLHKKSRRGRSRK